MSFWEPLFAAVRIKLLLRQISTLVDVAPDQVKLDDSTPFTLMPFAESENEGVGVGEGLGVGDGVGFCNGGGVGDGVGVGVGVGVGNGPVTNE